MHLDKQNQRVHEAFSNSPPGRLPFPQQNKWKVFKHRKPPDEKNEEQNSAKDDLSCSVFSGVSNSFTFLVETSHGAKHLEWLRFWQGFLAGSDAAAWTQRIQVSVAAGGGSGLGGRLQVCTGSRVLVTTLPCLRDNNW